jgi:putative copper export protein
MAEIVLLVMRWLHIASVAFLVGGMLYGGAVMFGAAAALPPEARLELAQRTARRFGVPAIVAVLALIVSGVYNILSFPGHSGRYHMLLGIKILLALHVFAVAVLVGSGRARRPGRAMIGAAITGFVIIGLSAYLRRIF